MKAPFEDAEGRHRGTRVPGGGLRCLWRPAGQTG